MTVGENHDLEIEFYITKIERSTPSYNFFVCLLGCSKMRNAFVHNLTVLASLLLKENVGLREIAPSLELNYQNLVN